jgi:hypothetical protein
MVAMRMLSSALVLLAITLTSRADDGAASIAAGGLVVMKRETRIVMAKEVLTISPARVAVDYDFRNDSDDDVTTEVAFPIPAYTLGDGMVETRQQGFDDFKLWVGGVPTKYTVQMRALVGKRDITGDLRALHIDAASFGHYEEENREPQTAHLTPAQRKRLIALRAIDFKAGDQPLWRIEKKYHWTQTFPAHGIVHIRHQYTPVLGNSNTIGDPSAFRGKDAISEYAESCPAPALRNILSKIWNKPRGTDDVSPIWISYVSFILTTANTWKTPIEDFTLIVERPHIAKEETFVSFCWNGPVTRIDADHFVAHATHLVPKNELQIGYIHAAQGR